jgi:nucleoside-diphosphate-sugar epimerase
MEKILVTGGNGFLGQHIVKRLSDKGYRVRSYSRSKVSSPIFKSTGIETVCGDIRDIDKLEHATKDIDRIIHLVSNFRSGGSDKRDAHSINVEGTENILMIAERHKIKQLIHCSTIGVHGSVKEIPANEQTPFNPGDLYQETKLIAEKKVWEFYKKSDLPITVIRPISMFGPGDHRMLKLFRMIKKKRFIVIGDGKAYFQPAYIDDVVDGFICCIANPKAFGKAFIIGGDEYVTLNELFQRIANELNVQAPSIRIPLWPVLFLATICEKVCVPLHIEPPLHRRRVSFFQNNRAFSIDKAKNEIGFSPEISLDDGIRRTIEWYEKNGYL